MGTAVRLAVLGAPIAHSKSPQLHHAAYGVLGLPWRYEAIEVDAESLREFVESRGPQWRGLSLTMPLKRAVLPLLDTVDPTARHTGSANTVLFDARDDGTLIRGFNTDVFGIVQAFRKTGVETLDSVLLLGSGATAASALVAAHRLGARRVGIAARSRDRASHLELIASELGMLASVTSLDDVGERERCDAVVSTIPGGVALPRSLRPGGALGAPVLLDVVYDPWPTPIAAAWMDAEGAVISGLEMLLFQALGQVRIFVGGDPEASLPNESAVLAAMRESIASA